MIEEEIHSCGYHCQIPACVKAQRDELAKKYFRQLGLVDQNYAYGWNDALDEAVARISNIRGFGQTTQDSFSVFIKGLKKNEH
jgi:hypothetical protein